MPKSYLLLFCSSFIIIFSLIPSAILTIEHYIKVPQNCSLFGRIIEEDLIGSYHHQHSSPQDIRTSGAIHLYVPVSAVMTPVSDTTLATPKSATLTTCKMEGNILKMELSNTIIKFE